MAGAALHHAVTGVQVDLAGVEREHDRNDVVPRGGTTSIWSVDPGPTSSEPGPVVNTRTIPRSSTCSSDTTVDRPCGSWPVITTRSATPLPACAGE
jgi:hypothetical protein